MNTNGKIRITGLWKENGTNGDYLSGSMGSFKILIFPVKEKRGPNGPDFELFLAASEKQVTATSGGFPAVG